MSTPTGETLKLLAARGFSLGSNFTESEILAMNEIAIKREDTYAHSLCVSLLLHAVKDQFHKLLPPNKGLGEKAEQVA